MNRRGFISTLVAGVVAPAFLPGAGRIWKPVLWTPRIPKPMFACFDPMISMSRVKSHNSLPALLHYGQWDDLHQSIEVPWNEIGDHFAVPSARLMPGDMVRMGDHWVEVVRHFNPYREDDRQAFPGVDNRRLNKFWVIPAEL